MIGNLVLAGFAAVATGAQAGTPCQSLQVDPWGADSFRIRVNPTVDPSLSALRRLSL